MNAETSIVEIDKECRMFNQHIEIEWVNRKMNWLTIAIKNGG